MTWEDELARSQQIAREAGRVIMEVLAEQDLDVRDKGDQGDQPSPVTAADLAANRVISEGLEEFGHGWLSEETEDNSDRLNRDTVWIVDPLDGTREFLRGIPEFYVSIGLAHQGEPVVGALFQPTHDLLVWGSRGGGAFENGERITCSALKDLQGATMAGSRSENKRGKFAGLLPSLGKIVPTGGMATKLHHVACGRVDLSVSLSPKNEWDLCGGDIIVTEAGGQVTTLSGQRRTYNLADPLIRSGVIVAPPVLHDEVSVELDRLQLRTP